MLCGSQNEKNPIRWYFIVYHFDKQKPFWLVQVGYLIQFFHYIVYRTIIVLWSLVAMSPKCSHFLPEKFHLITMKYETISVFRWLTCQFFYSMSIFFWSLWKWYIYSDIFIAFMIRGRVLKLNYYYDLLHFPHFDSSKWFRTQNTRNEKYRPPFEIM